MLISTEMQALRPLTGAYGHVAAGARFTTDHRTAERLEARGLAQRYRVPVHRETRMLPAYENKAAGGAVVPVAPTTSAPGRPVHPPLRKRKEGA